MTTKTCLKCQFEKPVSCFSMAPNAKRGDGYAHACIECSAMMTDKEKNAMMMREWRRNKTARVEGA